MHSMVYDPQCMTIRSRLGTVPPIFHMFFRTHVTDELRVIDNTRHRCLLPELHRKGIK
jgi:hypothetical protein